MVDHSLDPASKCRPVIRSVLSQCDASLCPSFVNGNPVLSGLKHWEHQNTSSPSSSYDQRTALPSIHSVKRTLGCHGSHSSFTDQLRVDMKDAFPLNESIIRGIAKSLGLDARTGAEESEKRSDCLNIDWSTLKQLDEAFEVVVDKSPLALGCELGRGTYGVVRRIKHVTSGIELAVKTIAKESVHDACIAGQVENEVRVQLQLNHLNVLRCYACIDDAHSIHLIMECCGQGDLYGRVRQRGERRLSEEESFFYFMQLVNGLRFIHSRGFAHRDLKLENLLLSSDNVLKIADFGWVGHNLGHQQNFNFCGTLDYLSPEMIQGQGHDWHVDLWSAGVLLYELLNGKPPFQSTRHYELIRKILARQFLRPAWMASDALDLIDGFLQLDANKRISLEECLQSPWVKRMWKSLFSLTLRFHLKERFNLSHRNEKKRKKRIHKIPPTAHSASLAQPLLSSRSLPSDSSAVVGTINRNRFSRVPAMPSALLSTVGLEKQSSSGSTPISSSEQEPHAHQPQSSSDQGRESNQDMVFVSEDPLSSSRFSHDVPLRTNLSLDLFVSSTTPSIQDQHETSPETTSQTTPMAEAPILSDKARKRICCVPDLAFEEIHTWNELRGSLSSSRFRNQDARDKELGIQKNDLQTKEKQPTKLYSTNGQTICPESRLVVPSDPNLLMDCSCALEAESGQCVPQKKSRLRPSAAAGNRISKKRPLGSRTTKTTKRMEMSAGASSSECQTVPSTHPESHPQSTKKQQRAKHAMPLRKIPSDGQSPLLVRARNKGSSNPLMDLFEEPVQFLQSLVLESGSPLLGHYPLSARQKNKTENSKRRQEQLSSSIHSQPKSMTLSCEATNPHGERKKKVMSPPHTEALTMDEERVTTIASSQPEWFSSVEMERSAETGSLTRQSYLQSRRGSRSPSQNVNSYQKRGQRIRKLPIQATSKESETLRVEGAVSMAERKKQESEGAAPSGPSSTARITKDQRPSHSRATALTSSPPIRFPSSLYTTLDGYSPVTEEDESSLLYHSAAVKLDGLVSARSSILALSPSSYDAPLTIDITRDLRGGHPNHHSARTLEERSLTDTPLRSLIPGEQSINSTEFNHISTSGRTDKEEGNSSSHRLSLVSGSPLHTDGSLAHDTPSACVVTNPLPTAAIPVDHLFQPTLQSGYPLHPLNTQPSFSNHFKKTDFALDFDARHFSPVTLS